MLIHSVSSPHGHARVSLPSPPSSKLSPFSKLGSISSSLPVRLSIHRRCPRAVLCCSAKSRGMAEVLEDNEPAPAAASVYDNSLSRSFLDVRTEEGSIPLMLVHQIHLPVNALAFENLPCKLQ
ncbi:hypothetical protein RHMOL_Rhmol11G0069500 [Rhododendron molle]|uniref:Uncharacterized protein n=1 Tax=Rhododendron molle TaxID=49168 RepID=A0ACC0LQZ4_RHOML|nr:hypothetical protein RHMOL_Rhmol11G0069500 [Rhododendron molle]